MVNEGNVEAEVSVQPAQSSELDQEIASRLGITNGPDDPDLHRTDQPLVNEGNAEAEVSAQPHVRTAASCTAPEPPKSSSLSSAQVIRILDEVTGINVRIGEIVVAEIGTTVDRFPTDAHIVSWAGLTPFAKISAGKRRSR